MHGGDSTLMSRELPPEKPAVCTAGARNSEMEVTYTGNTGNDLGISTAGYRAQKYNPTEWAENNYGKYYQSFVDRDNSERNRNESANTVNETAATTDRVQADATKKLGERIQDIGFWKFELEREIRDLLAETDLMLGQKRRLEDGLRTTEVALHIATDNLNCRLRRQGVDLVEDAVELALLKEVEIINNVQDLFRKSIARAEGQINANRDAKQKLEMDWSNKKEALEIDNRCGVLRNHHTNKQFYHGQAKFQEAQSTPESWAQFTHDNIVHAENERMASIQLRTLIDNIIEDTTRDIKEQSDTVESAFQKRLEEMEDAKTKMEDHLKKTCREILDMENNIAKLKKAIRDKEDPLKVAQTRLEARSHRPGVDLCRDPVHFKLVAEVEEIHQSIIALTRKLNEAENAHKNLQDTRMALENEISNKKNSIFIDKDKCLAVRMRYPSTLKLQGYQ